MLKLLMVLSMLFGAVAPGHAQVSVSIAFNMPQYPQLVLVPGSPVFYAPRARSNYFFYDGLYWLYTEDVWYSSTWYNGPWQSVEPLYVPLYVLRVPVRYYRQPPAYFRGWRADAPPHWGNHWGRDWEERRRGWDRWDRRSVPAAAPLPVYQKKFSGNRYPREPEEQHSIRSKNYRYQPREPVAQRQSQAPGNSGRPGGTRDEMHQQAPVQQHAHPQQRQSPQARYPQGDTQDTRRENKGVPQGRSEQQHSIRSDSNRSQPREAAAPQQSRAPGNSGRPGEARNEPHRQAPVQQQAAPQQRQSPHPSPQADKHDRGQGNRAAPQGNAGRDNETRVSAKTGGNRYE